NLPRMPSGILSPGWLHTRGGSRTIPQTEQVTMLKNRLTTSVLTVMLACAALSCAPDSRTDSLLGPDEAVTEQVEHSSDAQDSAEISPPEMAELVPLDVASLEAQGYKVITAPKQRTRSLLGWLVKTVEATLALLLGSDGG